MPPSSYNEIPYETAVRFETHPDRLAAVGRFYGMDPAPVERCRYLEIGCGTGEGARRGSEAVDATHGSRYKL